MTWAWSVQGVNPTERLALIAIADYADENWTCYPGQEKLAERVCVSKRTIIRTLQSLEDLGLIRRERRSRSDGTRTSDLFILGPSDNLSRDTSGRDKVPTVSPQEPPVEPSERTTDVVLYTREACTFEEFWAVYPRREAKGAARRAWDGAVKRALPAVVIAGAVRYRDDPNRDAGFTAHPSTWLNQDRWEDDPLPARISTARRLSPLEQNMARHQDLLEALSERSGRVETLGIGIGEGRQGGGRTDSRRLG